MLDAPTVCLLLGEGAGGGRWRCCRPTGCCAPSTRWLSPLPPEGASAILYRSVDCAPEIAQAQGVRATDLRRDGIVDRVIPERPTPPTSPPAFCERVGRALEYEIAGLLARDPGRPARGPPGPLPPPRHPLTERPVRPPPTSRTTPPGELITCA